MDFGRIHWQNGVLESNRENTSSFLFVYYVTILIGNLFQLMCQLSYLSRAKQFFKTGRLYYTYAAKIFLGSYVIKSMRKNCPEKGVILVQSSIFSCCYHKRREYKKNISIHAIFDFIFAQYTLV